MADQAFSTTPPISAQAVTLSNHFGVAILILAFVLGFPGNLFVVWSVLCRVRQRSVTSLLVLNLAAADAVVLLSAPFFLRLLAGGRGWEFGAVLCKVVHYLCCVNMYVSIYLICLMSMDRWLAVTKPFVSQRLRNSRSIYRAMLVIWVLAFLLALPMPFYRSNLKTGNMSVYICMPYHWGNEGHEVFQYLMETLLGFLVPFILIVSCYVSVICRLRRAMFQGRVKGAFLIFLIINAFAVFWLPYHVTNIIQVTGLLQKNQNLIKLAKFARRNTVAFAFLSSSVNPVLYVFAGSSHIRRAGFNFMAKLFEGTHSDHTSSRRQTTFTADTSDLRKPTLKSAQEGGRATSKSCGEKEGENLEMSCREELKTLTTLE